MDLGKDIVVEKEKTAPKKETKAEEKKKGDSKKEVIPGSKHKAINLPWKNDKGALKAPAQKRLMRELKEIQEEFADEFTTEVKDAEKNIWHITFKIEYGKFKGRVYTI